jgi:tetratricopeptide (TPR) repeat protein
MSVIVGIMTIAAQDGSNAVAYLDAHSISARWFTATSAYLIYLKQFFFPMELVAFYPISAPTSFIDFITPSIILLALLVTVAIFATRLHLLALGLCWYLATLLPVIGLIQVGSQAHADRYMYLPSLGVLIPLIYLLPSRDSKNYKFANVLWLLFVVYLSMTCFFQVSYWKNRNTLFSRTLEVIGPNYKSHIHLAQDYKNRGMLKEARQQGMAALKLRSERPDAYQALGGIALAEKKFEEAEKYYRLALSVGPLSLNAEKFKATLLNNIGIAMAEQGKTVEAIDTFERALAIDPTLIESKLNIDLYGKPEKQSLSR